MANKEENLDFDELTELTKDEMIEVYNVEEAHLNNIEIDEDEELETVEGSVSKFGTFMTVATGSLLVLGALLMSSV